MTAINHECYVSLEVAKLLKKAGFDWDTYNAYNNDGIFADKNRSLITWNHFSNYYSAPTTEVAQRWLREVKNVSIEVKTCRWVNRHKDGKYTVSYRHELWPIDTSIVPNNENKFICYTIDYACDIEFQTYEEALEAGIKKALEIILEKGK